MGTRFPSLGSTVLATAVALAIAAPAAFAQDAQDAAAATPPTFHLSASFAPDTTANDAGVMRSAAASGIGFGIKGGPVFANFSSDVVNFNTKTGWAGGIFIGGGRAHTIGVMEEIMYEKKTSSTNGVSTDVTSIFLPTFLRINIGTHTTSGPAVYILAGSALDIKIKAKANGQDVSNNYKGVDVDVVAGAGFEVARIIVEGRYVWGLLDVATNNLFSSPTLNTRAFMLMFGFRLN
jgi:hypothetical protein